MSKARWEWWPDVIVLSAILLAAQMAGPPAPDMAETAAARAVLIGLDGPEFDACSSLGRISGAEPVQVVRDGPDDRAGPVSQLDRRSFVWLCEAAGEWQGIVYPEGEFQDIADCRVGSPVTEPRSYEGPCRAGWVRARNIELMAG